MKRKIIRIDEEKCDGCGQCVPACHEGALRMVNGKAKLVSESLCDGLGACLGDCPRGAITIEERESPEPCGCPGARAMELGAVKREALKPAAASRSALSHWPVQLHLVSPAAPYFRNADLLLAADCVAYALGGFHEGWLASKKLAIACPKLDAGQDVYEEKLRSLIDDAGINTLTVMIMQVPCCSGLLALARRAAAGARRSVPVKAVVVGLEGSILSEEWVSTSKEEISE